MNFEDVSTLTDINLNSAGRLGLYDILGASAVVAWLPGQENQDPVCPRVDWRDQIRSLERNGILQPSFMYGRYFG